MCSLSDQVSHYEKIIVFIPVMEQDYAAGDIVVKNFDVTAVICYWGLTRGLSVGN